MAILEKEEVMLVQQESDVALTIYYYLKSYGTSCNRSIHSENVAKAAGVLIASNELFFRNDIHSKAIWINSV